MDDDERMAMEEEEVNEPHVRSYGHMQLSELLTGTGLVPLPAEAPTPLYHQFGIHIPHVIWVGDDMRRYYTNPDGSLRRLSVDGQSVTNITPDGVPRSSSPPEPFPQRPEGHTDWTGFYIVYIPNVETYVAYNSSTQASWLESIDTLPAGVEIHMDAGDGNPLVTSCIDNAPWLRRYFEHVNSGRSDRGVPLPSPPPPEDSVEMMVRQRERERRAELERLEQMAQVDVSSSSSQTASGSSRARQPYSYMRQPVSPEVESDIPTEEEVIYAPPFTPQAKGEEEPVSDIVSQIGLYMESMFKEVRNINKNEVRTYTSRRKKLLSRLAKLQATVNSCGYKANKAQRMITQVKGKDHYLFQGGLAGYEHLIEKVSAGGTDRRNARLTVETKMLACPVPVRSTALSDHVQVPVGRFRITITLGIATNPWDIRMENLESRMVARGQVDHPHVREGRPCWGDSLQYFDQAAADFDITKLICLSLNHLTHYNSGNPFVPLLTGWGKFVPKEDRICEGCGKYIHDKKFKHNAYPEEVMRSAAALVCGCRRCKCNRIESRCTLACEIVGLRDSVIDQIGREHPSTRMPPDVLARAILLLQKHVKANGCTMENLDVEHVRRAWSDAINQLRTEKVKARRKQSEMGV